MLNALGNFFSTVSWVLDQVLSYLYNWVDGLLRLLLHGFLWVSGKVFPAIIHTLFGHSLDGIVMPLFSILLVVAIGFGIRYFFSIMLIIVSVPLLGMLFLALCTFLSFIAKCLLVGVPAYYLYKWLHPRYLVLKAKLRGQRA